MTLTLDSQIALDTAQHLARSDQVRADERPIIVQIELVKMVCAELAALRRVLDQLHRSLSERGDHD